MGGCFKRGCHYPCSNIKHPTFFKPNFANCCAIPSDKTETVQFKPGAKQQNLREGGLKPKSKFTTSLAASNNPNGHRPFISNLSVIKLTQTVTIPAKLHAGKQTKRKI